MTYSVEIVFALKTISENIVFAELKTFIFIKQTVIFIFGLHIA